MMMTAEMVCFVYIGITLTDAFLNHYENLAVAGLLLFGMIISRALCIGLFAFYYRKDTKMRIRGKEWILIVMSGLIKGPLTYIFANIIVTPSVPCLDTSNYAIYKKV